MDAHLPTGRGHVLAYVLSAATTFLWVGCVLPAGTVNGAAVEDVTTPMYREAWLLVPALFLLIAGPVGMILSDGRRGLAAVLGATDAFVALYMATVLTGWGAFSGPVSGTLVGVLFGVGYLSLIQVARLLSLREALLPLGPWTGRALWAIVAVYAAVRVARGADWRLEVGILAGLLVLIESTRLLLRIDEQRLPGALRGARLALCLMALLVPSYLLVQDHRELASYLVPYGLVALGAGGALISRTATGLRLTLALLHLAFAVHVLVVLRYTIFDSEGGARPPFSHVGPIGWATIGVSVFVVLLAGLQVVRLWRHVRRETREAGDAPVVAA